MHRIFSWCAALTLGLAATLSSPAMADEEEADTCLRNKIWDGYNDGWAVRTATTDTLAQDEYRIYLVTLYKGNEYKVMGCGDSKSVNVDVVLHDEEGNVLAQDDTNDREPVMTFKPTTTETFFVVVHARNVDGQGEKTGIGMAVTYR